MGRLTQGFDFVTTDKLRTPRDRQFYYPNLEITPELWELRKQYLREKLITKKAKK